MITVALRRKMIRDEDKVSQSPKRNQLMAIGAHPTMLENLETAETQIFMVLSHRVTQITILPGPMEEKGTSISGKIHSGKKEANTLYLQRPTILIMHLSYKFCD